MPITTIAQAVTEFSRLCPPADCPELTNQDAADDKQQIAFTATPISGAFTLTVVNPQTNVSATATGIAYNASASAVQSALEALVDVSVGDVTCTGGPLPGTPIAVQFGGDFAALAVTLMTATDTLSTGDVTITRLVTGQPLGEVQQILAGWKCAEIWSASTAYDIGAVVIPMEANRNGHRFKLIKFTDMATDRKSAATEPSWTCYRDSYFTDNHIVWQEDGFDYNGILWDFVGAWGEGWELKASKAVKATDVSDNQGVSGKWSQIYDHCALQASKYQSAYVL